MENHIVSNQVIERDVHCPYCGKDKGFLISKVKKTSTSLLLPPAYGLKWLLSVIFLQVFVFIKGLKLLEREKKIEYTTYGFCPECGNTFSAAAPADIVEETEEPKLYKIRNKKVITGLCAGIADYTGISLLWVRISMVIYSLMVIPAFLYFLISACIPSKEDVESGQIEERRYAIAKRGEGKWIFGLCKGFANYTDIPVAWVRVLAVFFGVETVIGAVLYLVFGIVLNVRNNRNGK